jgi:hypothetical protein
VGRGGAIDAEDAGAGGGLVGEVVVEEEGGGLVGEAGGDLGGPEAGGGGHGGSVVRAGWLGLTLYPPRYQSIKVLERWYLAGGSDAFVNTIPVISPANGKARLGAGLSFGFVLI